MEKAKNRDVLKLIYIILCLSLAIPSIIFISKGKKIENLVSSFSFFFTRPTVQISFNKIIGTILFFGIFLCISYLYYLIIKKHKQIFKNNKEMIIFIIIISILFFVILPITSTDVFYYIGTGWSDAHYRN